MQVPVKFHGQKQWIRYGLYYKRHWDKDKDILLYFAQNTPQ